MTTDQRAGMCASEWDGDGRDCVLPADHDEAHRNGCIWWTGHVTVTPAQFDALSHGRWRRLDA